MPSKLSLAALAIMATLIALPSGANAGFWGGDRFWGDCDLRMRQWLSFRWLCGEQRAATVRGYRHGYRHAPVK